MRTTLSFRRSNKWSGKSSAPMARNSTCKKIKASAFFLSPYLQKPHFRTIVSRSGEKWGSLEKVSKNCMFRGLYNLNLDAKGRLAVPARYRSALMEDYGSKLIVTIDTEQQCLLLYPQSEWATIETKLIALPSFNPQSRRIQRLLVGHATDVELDGSGRLLIPPALRDYAKLDKKIALVGQGNKFEIWDDAHWNASRDAWLSQPSQQAKDLPDDLQQLSL